MVFDRNEQKQVVALSSQAAYMYPIPNDIELQLVQTPTSQLKDVKFIQEVAMQNSGFAYMIAKRMNHLQAQRAAAFLLGEHAKFITGTDLLIDGGVIAAIRTGEYKLG